MKREFRDALGCGLAALAVSIAFPVQAQTDAASESSQAGVHEDASEGIADIVVTAQRRSESAQRVPIALTALGSAQLAQQGVTDVSRIALRVPGFYLGSFGASRPQLYIRGVGSRTFDPGSDPSVGVFVDDVYVGRAGSVLNQLRDVQRVEVLRGPQGTLYGRNTIGGAINIVTEGASREPEAMIQAGVTSFNGHEVYGMLSGPMAADGAARARISLWNVQRDGYVRSRVTGGRGNGIENYGGRFRVDIGSEDSVLIALKAEYTHDGDRAGYGGVKQGSAVNPDAVYFGRPGLSYPVDPNPYRVASETDPAFDRDIALLSGKLSANLGGVTLASITGYMRQKNSEGRDQDGTPFFVLNQRTTENSRQITQEFRLSSQEGGALTFEDLLSWVVGLYYYDDKSSRDENYILGPDSAPVTALGGGGIKSDFVFGDYERRSYAAFGQVTVNFTQNLRLIGGLRYSHDRASAAYQATTDRPGGPFVVAPYDAPETKRAWHSVDPKVVLQYDFSRDVNVFASFSKGYKSGGFQYSPVNATVAAATFDPEKVTAYEIGLKSQFFQRKVRLNLAAFKYDYSDLQVSAGLVALPNGAFSTVVSNAASSDIKGVEAELLVAPISGVELNASYAYLDAKYGAFSFTPPGSTTTLDYSEQEWCAPRSIRSIWAPNMSSILRRIRR